MIITYHGLSCFRIQAGDVSLVFDLPSKKSDIESLPALPTGQAGGRRTPRFQADIFIQSHNHDGHNGAQNITREKNFFLIDGPGEYEIKGVYVKGVKTYHDSSDGKKYGVNTVYAAVFENINMCFMGDYGERDLRPETKEAIGKPDILFAPIGGDAVLNAESAVKIINQIEPAIVIPMHYPEKDPSALKLFLAELGAKDTKPTEKLSVKKKDIPENKGTQVVVLSSQ